MTHKQFTSAFLLLLLSTTLSAQKRNYLGIDATLFKVEPPHPLREINGLSEKANRIEGNTIALSYHISNYNHISLGLGIGLSKVSFLKEAKGIFPETNQFGSAEVNGQISYWTFPLSCSIALRSFNSRNYRNSKNGTAIQLSYVPCFEGKSKANISTQGGATGSTFEDAYRMNEQAFQHSLLISLNTRFFLIDKKVCLSLEPFAGIGSGYFKVDGTGINTISYGMRISLSFGIHVPTIVVEHEVEKNDAAQKKQELLKKQQEIKDQLNKQPK